MIEQWGTAGERVRALGEGDPEGWEAYGLHPWAKGSDLGKPEYILGTLDPSLGIGPSNVFRAHPCIGKSSGVIRQLPVSVVWEVLLPMMLARSTGGKADIRVNLVEEQLQFPDKADKLAATAQFVVSSTLRIAGRLRVPTTAQVNASPPHTMRNVAAMELYGLFTPFNTVNRYPRGFPNEREVTQAFAWYGDRYREATLTPHTVIIEGVHMVRAIRGAVGNHAPYLAAVPLPDPDGLPRLAQDAPLHERFTIMDSGRLPSDWWPERVALKQSGVGFRELVELFATEGGEATLPPAKVKIPRLSISGTEPAMEGM